jgi:hypothetical protein
MLVIPHPLHSPNFAPCDFFLFSKMKLKLKGRRFDTIEEFQAELRRMLDTDRKRLPGTVPKMEESVGTMSTWGGGTTSMMMAADRPYDQCYNFYSFSLEYFEYTLVYVN